jgi:hypothetical protein
LTTAFGAFDVLVEALEVFVGAFVDVFVVLVVVLLVWATAGAAMTASAVIDAINAFIGFLLVIRRIDGSPPGNLAALSSLWLKGYMLFMRQRARNGGAACPLRGGLAALGLRQR